MRKADESTEAEAETETESEMGVGAQSARISGFSAGRLDLAVSLVLVFVTLVVYAPNLGHDFVTMDDYPYVVENPAIQRGLNLETVRWAFTTFHGSSWFPLTWLSLAFDHVLGGLDPTVYHRTNLFWHLAGVVLLYLAFVSLTGARWRSAFVAAVFALHPIHVESVAWVAERKDVLSAFFFAATLLAWSRYVATPIAARYALVFLALTLGLLSKSSLVTLPFLLLLLDEWPLARRDVSWPSRLREKLPLFAVAGVSAALTFVAGASGDALEGADGLPLSYRLANAAIAYASYLRDTVWPADLYPFYPHPGLGVSMGWAAASAVLLLGITGLAWWKRRDAPQVLVGWLWFLGLLVPMIGLVQAGAQARADRFAHLAQTGVVVAVVWSLPRSFTQERSARFALAAIAAVAVVAMALATRTQLAIWRNGITLFERVVEAAPESAFAHNGLAQAYRRSGDFDRAIPAFRRALEIQPSWVPPMLGLARALDGAGRDAAALAFYRRVAEHVPDDLGVRATLAERLVAQRVFTEAAGHLEFIVAHADARAAANAHLVLGAMGEANGSVDVAQDHYRRAAELRSDLAAPHLALSSLALRQGNEAGAIEALRSATLAEPDSLVAHNNLAWRLMQSAKLSAPAIAEARTHAERAAALSDRSEPSVLETLAVVLATQGETEAARDTLEEAIVLARASGDPALVAELVRRKRSMAGTHPGGRAR